MAVIITEQQAISVFIHQSMRAEIPSIFVYTLVFLLIILWPFCGCVSTCSYYQRLQIIFPDSNNINNLFIVLLLVGLS